MHNTIEVTELGKRYTVGGRPGARLLTEAIANRMRGRGDAGGGDFWALQDVTFTVRTGELVGIIGHNGAGKTTLLRILARITAPTAGVARVRGRLSALLDVGTGFHDELNGRENMFLSGAILGMSPNLTDGRLVTVGSTAPLNPAPGSTFAGALGLSEVYSGPQNFCVPPL